MFDLIYMHVKDLYFIMCLIILENLNMKRKREQSCINGSMHRFLPKEFLVVVLFNPFFLSLPNKKYK